MIISEYTFKYFKDYENTPERYPDLINSSFAMNLQAGDNFYNAVITCDFVYKNINIEIYNENEELVQPKKRVSFGINLFYLDGYYLVWKQEENKFIFGSGREDEVL